MQENDNRGYQRTQMKKERIIEQLRAVGCRITKQRLMLLDIILEEDCSCCKEIYYKALKLDEKIGSATVYRMINTLEEIGAINRKNMYQITEKDDITDIDGKFLIEFENGFVIEVSEHSWKTILERGLEACGYQTGQKVKCVKRQ